MKTKTRLTFLLTAVILSACGDGGDSPTPLPVVITSPLPEAVLLTATAIMVEGTVVDGATVEVAIGDETPVPGTLAAPAAGRRAWSAELTAPAPGDFTIVATATTAAAPPNTASVAVKVVGALAAGRWEGEMFVYDVPPEREIITSGSFIVLYNIDWFRMYFGANPVFGTTENWDLIDKEGFRITGTYHAAGETNERGEVMNEAWVVYEAVLADGKSLKGIGTEED